MRKERESSEKGARKERERSEKGARKERERSEKGMRKMWERREKIREKIRIRDRHLLLRAFEGSGGFHLQTCKLSNRAANPD